ncbi:phage portal protein, partial [Escherichia coli]
MKTSTIPTLLGPDGMTSLREYAGYHGGGSGFGGQLRAWNPPGESVDAALLPNFTRGNARADDLVRNNGYAANAIQLHQDHIVGSFFRLSHRPSWRYLGIGEEEARAFSREVESAWKEFAEDDCCCIDVERKRTFTMMIREGVAMHAFNGELFVQATWDTSPSRLFRTQFRMVSPKRISNPNNTGDSRNCRAGVQINDSGAALGYYVSEDGYPGWMPQKWTWIPRELPGGRASFIHVFEPVEDGQTRGANVFYSVMEQMKMLDTLQNTQLQSAIVKAMYAATIESELDTQSAMDFILGANSQEQRERLTGWIGEIAAYYAAAPVRLGGAKVPHLMPGDSLNLQTAQDTDNGYSVFEQSLLRYIAAGLGVSYEQLSRNYAQMSYSTARASANESWAYFMGRRKFVASRQASQMFLCWLEEAIVRRVVTLPSKARFSFQEARSAWGNCDWIGSGRMAIDGLKEVQEAVMLIEAGLSTYEKECAKRGDDYQEIFAQQVRETMERRIAASINIKPGHDYYFYVRSVNTVGKSAFVEAVGQPSDDASGYLDFFKGEIGKTHLAQELWTQIDNGQLAPDLTEIRTSITDVSNEITQTVNKKLEDQSAAIQQIQKVQVDTNNNLNSMWAVKLQQMQDGRLYIAGIGAGIENTPDGMQSQVLLAADRIAMINPANGNTKPMFVGQGDQIFMNEVFLKRLTAPTITSGGNPPAFSLTSDGRLTAKNADISGSVNANSGTLNNVTINQNCTIKGMLEATQVRGDFVKAVSKAFPKKVGTWGNTET